MEDEIRTIIVVVAYHNFLNLTVFAHLAPKILIKRIEMILQLTRVHLVLRIVCRVLVEVREEDGLRVRRLDMFARTTITMTAGSNFVIE